MTEDEIMEQLRGPLNSLAALSVQDKQIAMATILMDKECLDILRDLLHEGLVAADKVVITKKEYRALNRIAKQKQGEAH